MSTEETRSRMMGALEGSVMVHLCLTQEEGVSSEEK